MASNAGSEAVAREVAHRLQNGHIQVTLSQFEEKLSAIGYRLNRRLDCKGVSLYMTGERAGESYPACNMYPVQADDGLSWCHVDARRDRNFDELKRIRDTHFAASKRYIYGF